MPYAQLLTGPIGVMLAFHGGMWIEQSNTAYRAGEPEFSLGLWGLAAVAFGMALVFVPAIVAIEDHHRVNSNDGRRQ